MAINRVTGLSNFDVEAMVTKMMEAEKMKLTKVQQSKQYKVWEQEAYRSLADQLNAFKSEYFDVLKPESNLRSSSMFAKFSTTVMVNGTASSKISIKGTADLQNFNQQIESISQLATKDTYKSEVLDIGAIMSKDLVTDFATGKPATFKATMTIGSTSKTVEVDMTAINDLTAFKDALNTEIASEFGAGYSSIASVDGNQLKLRSAGNTVSMLQQTGFESSMTWLGVTSGTNSLAYQNKSLTDLFGISDTDLSTMKINGKSLSEIGVLATDNITKLGQKINSAGVGAQFNYDTLTDQFKITSSKEGSANTLTLSTDLMNKLKLTTGTHEVAKDAMLRINGVDIIKSENTFTLDGANITLNDTHNAIDGPIKFSFKVDTDKIVEKIKSFVEVYNGLITSTYGKVNEKVYRDFTPLTDEQKQAMTEDQIKQWETKAKSGVLRNHGDIESIATKMRRALSDAVEGAGISLSQMGIETSSNYKENGKLVIMDETKLRSAIENNYSGVVRLFSNESDKAYLDGANVSERYKENGLGNRLYDIVQDAVRTTRDSNGRKGTLVETAGLANDLSNITSVLSKKISEYDERITTLLDYLSEKETNYYAMFSRVETAISKLEAQSKQLSSQFGG